MKKIFKYLGGGKMKTREGDSGSGGVPYLQNETDSNSRDEISESRRPPPPTEEAGDVDDIPMDDFVPVEGLPPDKTMLSSQTMEELVRLCEHVNVDHSSFTTREEYVEALQARYPKQKMQRMHSQGISDVASFLQSGNKAQENNIKVDDLFKFLLNKLKVERDLQKKIINVYSDKDKIALLGECVSILDDDPNFTERDEDLIQRLLATRSIDSIHILAMKYRVQHSHEEWRQYFTAAGGLSVLVTLILNCSDTIPLLDFDAAALFEIMLCIKIFIKSDGIKAISETRGAIDAMCLAMDFNHSFLVIQILELLSVITAYGGEGAIWQVGQGIHHLAKVRHEKPFVCFAAAMIERDIDIQVAVVSFINTFMMSMKDLEERITTRGHLYSAKFNQVLDFLVVLDGEETVVGFSEDMSAALLESIDRPSPALIGIDPAKNNKSTRLQIAYEQKYGYTRSVDAENRMLMGEGISEDGTTSINPSKGIMSGYCYESKKRKEGVKRRWYSLQDNIFKWYHPEKKSKGLKGEKENGSISIADIQEILEYSTAGNLQNISRCGFVIKTNKAAPEDRYQIGVEDDLTKRRWITALRCARNNVMSTNAAFTVLKTRMSAQEQKSAAEKLKKHINVFNLVESEDLALIRDECSNLSYLTSDDDWNDVASIVRYLCFEIISTGHQNDLKDMLQNIISLYDDYRKDHQRYTASISASSKKYATISGSLALVGSGSSKKRGGASNTALINARQTAQLAAAVAASKIASKSAASMGASAVVESNLPSYGRRRSISTLTYRLSTRLSIGNANDANASHDTAIDLWNGEDSLDSPTDLKKEEVRLRQEERKKIIKQAHAKDASRVSAENTDLALQEQTLDASLPDAEPEGKAALMAMIAARGPRLPPPVPKTQYEGEAITNSNDETSGGKSALMAMIAARGPRLPPPVPKTQYEGEAITNSNDESSGGKSALMAMIAARGPRLPPPQRSTAAAEGPSMGGRKYDAPLSKAPPQPSDAELKKLAEEEAENAKYPLKPDYQPEKKMRSLFWTKLRPSEAANTIWSAVPDVEVRCSELEELFCDEKAVAKQNVVTTSPKLASTIPRGEMQTTISANSDVIPAVKEKLKNVALFDSKRTQNVSIGIKKLRMTPQQIVDIIVKLDPNEMTKEVTNTLLLLAPNATEIAIIQGYGGAPDELDLVGQLFFEMLRVPRVAQRLEIMKSSHEWTSGYNQLSDEVNTLKMAVDELLDDVTTKPLNNVLAQILAAGNYLNAGTSRGRAYGVKLDILVKLANLKQNGNPKATLLHYIVEKSAAQGDECSLFYSGWSDVWNAPRINSRQLETDIRALAGDVNIMKAEQSRFTSGDLIIDPKISDPLVERISNFLSVSEPKLESLQQNCKVVMERVSETRSRYGDFRSASDGEDACSAFFGLIVNFAEMYARAKSDIDIWAEETEKKLRSAEKKKAKGVGILMPPKSAAARDPLNDDASTVQSDLNVFDRLKASQSQDPVKIIATFQHGAIREESDEESSFDEDKGLGVFAGVDSD